MRVGGGVGEDGREEGEALEVEDLNPKGWNVRFAVGKGMEVGDGMGKSTMSLRE